MENRNIKNLLSLVKNLSIDNKKIETALSRVIHYNLAKISKEERENIFNTSLEDYIKKCLEQYNIVLDNKEMQIVTHLVKKYNFEKIDEYNNLDKKTKYVVDKIIWTNSMGESDISKFLFLYCGFYDKYKDLLKDDMDFIANGPYSHCDVISNLKILMKYNPKKTSIYNEILKDLENNKELINAYSTTISLIINIFKLMENGEFGKEFKDSLDKFGITYSDICNVFGLKDEYYGGLGLYQERYENIRNYLYQGPSNKTNGVEVVKNTNLSVLDIYNSLKSSLGQEIIGYIKNYMEINKSKATSSLDIKCKEI